MWVEVKQGQITRVSGPLSYVILLDHGGKLRRHVDHIRRREVGNSSSSSANEESGVLPLEPSRTTTSIQPADNPSQQQPQVSRSASSTTSETDASTVSQPQLVEGEITEVSSATSS